MFLYQFVLQIFDPDCMHLFGVLLPNPPQTQYSLTSNLSFRLWQRLPRWSTEEPNLIFFTHIYRRFSNLSWYSQYRIAYPHTVQFRLQTAIADNDTQEVALILQKYKNFHPDQIIDRKYGWNALQLAAIMNRYNIMQLLLLYGAHINYSDRLGNTPLKLAVSKKNLEAVNTLLKNGADRYITNKYGIDAIKKSAEDPYAAHLTDFLQNYPQVARKMPKFRVTLDIESKCNSELWKQLQSFKVYDSKPKIYPFNNFKGIYKIHLMPSTTIAKMLDSMKMKLQEK